MRRPLAFLAAFALFVPAHAEAVTGTTVSIGNVALDGGTLTVTGASAYANQPFVVQGSDPANDTALPTVLGQDLTEASISASPSGQLSLRWTTKELPPVLSGTPTVTYGWTFCIGPPGTTESCWQVMAARMNWLIPNPEPWLQVWRCASTCDESELMDIQGTLVFDGTTKTVTATLPLSALEGSPGQEITPLVGFSFHGDPVWTSMVGWYLVEDDFLGYDASYVIPRRAVSLAIDGPGQDPASVTYTTETTVAAAGGYTGSLDVASLAPGGYTVYARACFGSNNCGYAARDVTI